MNFFKDSFLVWGEQINYTQLWISVVFECIYNLWQFLQSITIVLRDAYSLNQSKSWLYEVFFSLNVALVTFFIKVTGGKNVA